MDVVLLLKLYPIRRVLLGVLTPVDRLNLLCAVNDLQSQQRRGEQSDAAFAAALCSDLFVPLVDAADRPSDPSAITSSSSSSSLSVAELKRAYNFIGTHNYINYMIMTAIYEIVLFRNLLCEEAKVPGKQYPWMQANQHVTDRYVQRRNTFRNFLLFIRRQLRLRIYDVDEQQERPRSQLESLPPAQNPTKTDKHGSDENDSGDEQENENDDDEEEEEKEEPDEANIRPQSSTAVRRVRFELMRKRLSMHFDLTFRDNSQQNSFRTDWEHDALQLAKDIFLDEQNETQHFFLTQRGVFLDIVDSVFCSASTVFEHCPFLVRPFAAPAPITATTINSVVVSTDNAACTARLLDHTIDAFVEAYRRFDTKRTASGFVVQTCLEIEEHLIGLKHHKCSMNSNPSRILHHALITIYGSKIVQPYDSRMTADIEAHLRRRISPRRSLFDDYDDDPLATPLRVRIELNSVCVYLACDDHHGLKKILSVYLAYLPRINTRSQLPTSTKLYASPTTNLLVDNDLITIAAVRFKYIPRVDPPPPSIKRKRSTAHTAAAVAAEQGWLKFASFYYDYHAVQRSVFTKFLQVFLLELRKRNGGRPFYNYFHIQQIQTAELLTPISNDFTTCSYHSSSVLLHYKDLFRPSDQMEHQCFVQDEESTADLRKPMERTQQENRNRGEGAASGSGGDKKRCRATSTSSAAAGASDDTPSGSSATFCIRIEPTQLNSINSKLVGEPRYRIY